MPSMPRTCPRDVPMARRRPISLVRSETLNAKVLTMPKIAMMIDSASSAYRTMSIWLIIELMVDLYSSRSNTEIV